MPAWVDLTKKGTIVLGLARSGTHHASHLVLQELQHKKIKFDYLNEIAFLPYGDVDDLTWVEFLKETKEELLKKHSMASKNYIVASIVNTGTAITFFGDILKDFHIVVLHRKDVWAHFISKTIFNKVPLNGFTVTDDSIDLIELPICFPLDQVAKWLAARYFLHNLATVKNFQNIYYEDIKDIESTWPKSAKLNKHPSEIFSNFEEIDLMFKKVQYIHGW